MQAFLGISVWVALAMVCPGLVTLAVVYVALVLVRPGSIGPVMLQLKDMNEWSLAGLALTAMVLTQALGILLEHALVGAKALGPAEQPVSIPEDIDPRGETEFKLRPYEEYGGLYLLLAELGDKEDAHGHLQRAIAQYFLTNNTLVSFAIGIVTTAALLVADGGRAYAASDREAMGYAYLVALAAALLVSFGVAKIRFRVMAKALWAARRARSPRPGGGAAPVPAPESGE